MIFSHGTWRWNKVFALPGIVSRGEDDCCLDCEGCHNPALFFPVLSLGGVDSFKKLGPRMVCTFAARGMLHVLNVSDDFPQLFLRPFDRTSVASTFFEPPMVPLPRSSKFVKCNGHRDILQLWSISGVSLGLWCERLVFCEGVILKSLCLCLCVLISAAVLMTMCQGNQKYYNDCASLIRQHLLVECGTIGCAWDAMLFKVVLWHSCQMYDLIKAQNQVGVSPVIV